MSHTDPNADICRQIAAKYYGEILRYCHAQLPGDPQGAEDCTQEVFLILTKKRLQLELTERIRAWLYKTADRTVRNYRRRERRHRHAPLDSIPLSDDGGLAPLTEASPLDSLTEDERRLLTVYYQSGSGSKQAVAAQFGLTLSALYSEI